MTKKIWGVNYNKEETRFLLKYKTKKSPIEKSISTRDNRVFIRKTDFEQV